MNKMIPCNSRNKALELFYKRTNYHKFVGYFIAVLYTVFEIKREIKRETSK